MSAFSSASVSTTSYSPDAIVTVMPGLASADLGGEAVVLDPASGRYFGLNEVAARILELVREPRAVSHIENVLASEYDVDRERLRADINGFIRMLSSRGLVTVEE